MTGTLRDAICATKFGCEVRLERSMEVRDDSGDVVFCSSAQIRNGATSLRQCRISAKPRNPALQGI